MYIEEVDYHLRVTAVTCKSGLKFDNLLFINVLEHSWKIVTNIIFPRSNVIII